jgi:hypothetical protein
MIFQRPQGKPWGRWLSCAATLVLGFFLAAQSVRSATPDQEIPGLPWPGKAVSSAVGGTVYDKVWRLEVAAGRVAIIDLKGEAGAEIGIYLFPGTTTALSSGTPIASAAKPGGTQRLVASLVPGTYYVDINGRNTDRSYAFNLSIALVADQTPPTISFSLANGASRTSSSRVIALTTAIDTLSTVTGIRWQVDGTGWGDWQTPNVRQSIEMSAVEGRHVVQAQAINGAGLISTVATDTIFLDLTAPRGILLTPFTGASVLTNRPVIKVKFSEAMSVASWKAAGIFVEEPSGVIARGAFTYDSKTLTGTFVPDDLEPGIDYIVRSGGATDLAGNVLQFDAFSFTYQEPTAISFSATQVTVPLGAKVVLAFVAKGLPDGAVIELEQLVDEGGGIVRWEPIREIADNGGEQVQRVSFVPTESASYTLHFPGSATHAPSRTVKVRITVSPVITFTGPTAAKRGVARTVDFAVRPALDFPVNGVLFRCSTAFSKCVVSKRITALVEDDGFVRFPWTPATGYWAWQASVPGSPSFGPGRSTLVKFRTP